MPAPVRTQTTRAVKRPWDEIHKENAAWSVDFNFDTQVSEAVHFDLRRGHEYIDQQAKKRR